MLIWFARAQFPWMLRQRQPKAKGDIFKQKIFLAKRMRNSDERFRLATIVFYESATHRFIILNFTTV